MYTMFLENVRGTELRFLSYLNQLGADNTVTHIHVLKSFYSNRYSHLIDGHYKSCYEQANFLLRFEMVLLF